MNREIAVTFGMCAKMRNDSDHGAKAHLLINNGADYPKGKKTRASGKSKSLAINETLLDSLKFGKIYPRATNCLHPFRTLLCYDKFMEHSRARSPAVGFSADFQQDLI